MDTAKLHFLKKDFVPLLKNIPPELLPRWGKMSVQQMIEHFTDAVRVAAGAVANISIITTEEDLPKMVAFLESDKPFRENTRNPLLPEMPQPVQQASVAEALNVLQAALDLFFETFYANSQLVTRNPFFGELDFNRNVQLLYKHALHHLRQFGVEAGKNSM